MSKIAFSLTTELIISLEYCTVAEKRLAVVGHCVTSEYLEVCTDKFFCVSGVAQAGAGKGGAGKAGGGMVSKGEG